MLVLHHTRAASWQSLLWQILAASPVLTLKPSKLHPVVGHRIFFVKCMTDTCGGPAGTQHLSVKGLVGV